jgi:hypothetical protein
MSPALAGGNLKIEPHLEIYRLEKKRHRQRLHQFLCYQNPKLFLFF